MPVFGSSRPSISVKTLLRWPARFLSGAGIGITRANGNITIGLDYENLDDVTVETPEDYVIPLLNTTTGVYERVSVDQLVAAGPQGEPGPQGETGPQGAAGTGSGTVNPSGIVAADNIAIFADSSGLLIKDGGTRRERLDTHRTYYFRADGSDSNTGLVNSSGGAFLTPQKALDTILDKLDLNGFNALITCGSAAATVFTSGLNLSKEPVGNAGASAIQFNGNNCIIRTTSANCIDLGAGNGWGGYPGLTISNVRLETVTAGFCISARGGVLQVGTGVVFGACANAHIYAGHAGHVLLNSYTISGSAQYHMYGYGQAQIMPEGATVTISTPVTFNAYLALTGGASALMGGETFVNAGNVTGQKFAIDGSGTNVTTGGGGLSYLPGTIAGVMSGYASYDEHTSEDWAAWAPTLGASTGSFTSISGNGRYSRHGNTIEWECSITETTLGSASGRLTVSGLPATPKVGRAPPAVGMHTGTKKALVGAIILVADQYDFVLYDGTFPFAGNGETVVLSGRYEV